MAKRAMFTESQYYKDDHDQSSKMITKGYLTTLIVVLIGFSFFWLLFKAGDAAVHYEQNKAAEGVLRRAGYKFSSVHVFEQGTGAEHYCGLVYKFKVKGLRGHGKKYKRACAIIEINSVSDIHDRLVEIKDF